MEKKDIVPQGTQAHPIRILFLQPLSNVEVSGKNKRLASGVKAAVPCWLVSVQNHQQPVRLIVIV